MSPAADWSRLIGLIGVVLLVIVVAHWLVRRKGGWGALRRRVVREVAAAARGFAKPVRTELRYRRGLRLLRRLLRDPSGWADAERAVGWAAAEQPGTLPYAALLGSDVVGVYVAHGQADGALPAPWVGDPVEARLWWISRADLGSGPAAAGRAPVLVCVGTAGQDAVLLDLTAGPSAVSVTGAPRTARAVLQALAAQADVRLPAGRVRVGPGVHPRYTGSADVLDRLGAGDYAVCGEPPERALPAGARLLTLGVAHGSTRILEADGEGYLRPYGAPASLTVDALPLGRAVARLVSTLPPVPGDGGGGGTTTTAPAAGVPSSDDDLVENGPLGGTAEAVSAAAPAPRTPSGASTAAGPDALTPRDGDLAEPASQGPAGVSASTARPSSS
ncbi:hypothetical protein AB0D57_20030 [Streptomyces sp. NPDC048275]|uniref:hypothetical protein n=1 Tax=Streptomyces sp. NPDC048275 TaxID=3155629 RepID=UPI0033E1F7C8